MFLTVLVSFFLLITTCISFQIPLIRNVTLVPISPANSTTFENQTCDQCLCLSMQRYAALNCFENNTCELFTTVPLRYRLRPTPQASLHFPNGLLPNESQCCMPNFTQVMERLQNATVISVNITTPRCLLLDRYGYLVTSDNVPAFVRRYNATTLESIDQIQINESNPFTVVFQNDAYYVGLANDKIMVIDSTTFAILNLITSSYLHGLRDIIFLNDGEMMVAASAFNNSLVFFYRTNSSATDYTFAYYQPVNYINPHGLLRINDSFFYATSWTNNSIYSYTAINSTYWKETLTVDALPQVSNSDGNHFTIDECQRRWFSLGNAGLYVFDEQGVFLGNYTDPSRYIFDAVITNDYVLYMSDLTLKQVLRVDPNIQC